MIKKVIKYPNKILKSSCEDVKDFDEYLHTLLDDMYDTMIHDGGIGLASIQIAILKNVFIINMPNENDEQNKENLIEFINPKLSKKENLAFESEGCLSVPGFTAKLKRFHNITLEYQDRYGKKQVQDFDDYMAVACQHEIDHLNGILFIDKLSILDKAKFKKHLKKQNDKQTNKKPKK